MKRYLQAACLTVIVSCTNAGHHFIRLVILAGLGLAGLWMVHTLAQDYEKISHNFQGFGHSASVSEDPKLFKRSVQVPQINWQTVLSRDPASCARSFICQLAAQPEENLSIEEQQMLFLTRHAAETQDNWATKQLNEALKNGHTVETPNHCRKIYKFCPYSSQMMMNLLRFFGGK